MSKNKKIKKLDIDKVLFVPVYRRENDDLMCTTYIYDNRWAAIYKKKSEYGSYYGLSPELEKGMLDGFRWSFDAYFENGGRISSSGRHVMPDGKGLRRIEELLYHAAEAATNKPIE